MTFKGKRAAIYARISKDRDGTALGVGRQETACRKLAEELGYEVAHVLVDNDISASYASRKARPAYVELVQLIEARDVDAVICWDTDRLHRRPLELEHYISACGVDHGIPTHTVNAGDLDLSTSSGRMIARIKGSVAAAESEKMSERIRAQKQDARVNGRPLGGPVPIGWIRGAEPGTFIADPEAAPLLEEATIRVARGETLVTVTRWLQDEGMRGRKRDYMRPKDGSDPASWDEKGPIMSVNTVRGLLVRPANVGLQEHDGKRYPGRYPAIVDPEDYAAACEALKPKRGRAPGGQRRKHLLSGVAFCWCGMHMIGVNPERYACSSQRRQAGRTSPGHAHKRAKPLDEYVTAVVAAYLDRVDVAGIVQSVGSRSRTRKSQVKATEALEQLYERKRSLARMFADGYLSEDQLLVGTKNVNRDIEAQERVLNVGGADKTVRRIMRASSPGQAFRDAPLEQRRAVIGQLFRVDIEQGDGKGGRRFRTEEIHVTPKGGAA
jgi:site-specific DNA recombinase